MEKDSERNVFLCLQAILTGDWDVFLFPCIWNNSRAAQLYFSLCFFIISIDSLP